MIRVPDMPGEFVSEEVADRCRRLLLMMENMAYPPRAIENRQESQSVIRRTTPAKREGIYGDLWIVSEGSDAESKITEGAAAEAVMQSRDESPRISIKAAHRTVGGEESNWRALDGLPVWEKYPSIPRGAMIWPGEEK